MVLPNVERLRSENWRNHPQTHTRLGALQSMENQLAAQENRPAVRVHIMPLEKTALGNFNPAEGENGAIYIRHELLWNDEPFQAANTYFHEARHAYQHEVANHPENHPEVDSTQAELWKRNKEAYLSTKEKMPGSNLSLYEYGHYFGQPIEIDARAEAAKKTEQLYARQFQDQQGYANFKAQQDARDKNNEEGAQLIGDNYEEQARKTMEAKYKTLHPELTEEQTSKNLVTTQEAAHPTFSQGSYTTGSPTHTEDYQSTADVPKQTSQSTNDNHFIAPDSDINTNIEEWKRTHDPENWEYKLASSHDDYQLSKDLEAAQQRNEISQQSMTSDSLSEAIDTTIKAHHNAASQSDSQVEQYFYEKFGHEPYTTDAYPLQEEASQNESPQPLEQVEEKSLGESIRQSLAQPPQSQSPINTDGEPDLSNEEDENESLDESYYYGYGQ